MKYVRHLIKFEQALTYSCVGEESMFPNVPCLYPRLIRQKCCQNSLMAESLFRVFDEDNSGALNFFEYLQVNTYLLEFELLNF